MRKLENKKLDEIGKLLVRTGATPTRDIETVAANPELFDAIKKRIATIEKSPVARRSRFLVPGIAAFGTVALIAVLGGFFAVKYSGSGVAEKQPTLPSNKPAEVTHFSEPDRIAVPRPEPDPEDDAIRPQHAVMRQTARSEKLKRTVVAAATHDEGDFYAVSYAGDPSETQRGGRIIRVDMPRSALFAMGINIPLENEAETVRADLFVGNDGVTRGIRVVK